MGPGIKSIGLANEELVVPQIVSLGFMFVTTPHVHEKL